MLIYVDDQRIFTFTSMILRYATTKITRLNILPSTFGLRRETVTEIILMFCWTSDKFSHDLAVMIIIEFFITAYSEGQRLEIEVGVVLSK